MNKDEVIFNKKIEKAKMLFDQNLIKEFKDIFDIVPYSKVAILLGIHNTRLKAKMEDPMKFYLAEVKLLASIFNVDFLSLVSLMERSASIDTKQSEPEK